MKQMIGEAANPRSPNYCGPDPEPGVLCANALCENAVFDEDEYHRCEVCSKRFCADCLKTLGECEFCPTCRVCDRCAKPATAVAKESGDLLCPTHYYRETYPEPRSHDKFYRVRPVRNEREGPESGYYLKCGGWWTCITPGFGCEWITNAGFGQDKPPANAFCSLTLEEAEYWKARVEARPYAADREIVEFLAVAKIEPKPAQMNLQEAEKEVVA